jgi:hypothetical protein
MTDTVLVALIAAAPATVIGILNYIQHQRVTASILKIEIQTNDLTTALVDSSKIVAHAEGVVEGKKDEKLRAATEVKDSP